MKAAFVEGPGVLVVKEIPLPRIGKYDVLCEGLYGATCTGTDQHILYHQFPYPVKYPTMLGHESIGKVVELGEKVRNFKIGDMVSRIMNLTSPEAGYDANWGGFAEYGLARDYKAMQEDGYPRSAWNDFRVNQVIPADLNPAAATMIMTWRETFSYITRMGVEKGTSVLVIGSGGNGLAFAAHAINLGAKNVVMVGSSECKRREIALKTGIHSYLSYQEEWTNQVKQMVEDGYDYIIDAVGKMGAVDLALPLLKPNGTIGVYGLHDAGKDTRIDPSLASGSFTVYKGGYDEEESHESIIGYIQRGMLDAGIWLDLEHSFDLEDISRAFAYIKEKKMPKALVKLKK